MWELLLKMLDYVPSIFSRFISPLRVKMKKFYYRLIPKDPNNIVTRLNPYPSCYLAELSIKNTSSHDVYIEDILLVVNKKEQFRPTDKVSGLFLKAHEPMDKRFIFDAPVLKHSVVDKGDYRLEIIPTVGKKTVVKGQFPVEKE